jgi:outer membrane protein OmpA-like peptidoglycan-associated protein
MFRLLAIFLIFLFVNIGLAQEPRFQISIYFPGGSYYITQDQREDLRNFLLNIPNVNQYNITIHSHTDNIGGVEFNDMLSRMRSQSAMEQLLLNNIRQEMIEIKDFGLHNPVFDNSTWEGKLKNRRVDILLWPHVL